MIPTASKNEKIALAQNVRQRYNGFLATNSKGKAIEITRLTEEEKQEIEDQKSSNDPNITLLDQLVGFRKILQLLIKFKLPMVGHNMILDICYIVHHFLHHLPDNLDSFKTLVHTMFPKYTYLI